MAEQQLYYRLMDRTAKKCEQVYRLARSLGLNIDLGTEQKFHTYRKYGETHRQITLNTTFRGFLFQSEREPHRILLGLTQDLAHELGHYLIAPKGRRHRKDYGIPSERQRSEVSHRRWEVDEMKATLVEYALLRHFGLEEELCLRKDPLRLRQYPRNPFRKEAARWWKTEGPATIAARVPGMVVNP